MKISTSKTELQTALQKLSKATPTRSTLPILSSVLFDVNESGVTLRSTDLEITIVTNLPASVEKEGSSALPLQTILNITNELPEKTRIEIYSDQENKVKITTDVGVYDIMAKPAEEFPNTPEVDNRKSIGLSSETLSDLIKKTLFAVSKDELKPALTGVLFRFGENALSAVSTDGHRLVKYTKNDYKATEFKGDIIIPKKFLNLLSNALNPESEIKLWVGENHMTATSGNDTYFTRIIDERFPDFDSVIPKDNDKELLINKEALFSAVKRVSIFSNRSTQQIALQLTTEKVQITTEDPEKASKAKEKIEGKFSGEELTIGYNAVYLKDVLSHVTSDNLLIKLKTSISAALFIPTEQSENTNLTMLLMPIRLND